MEINNKSRETDIIIVRVDGKPYGIFHSKL